MILVHIYTYSLIHLFSHVFEANCTFVILKKVWAECAVQNVCLKFSTLFTHSNCIYGVLSRFMRLIHFWSGNVAHSTFYKSTEESPNRRKIAQINGKGFTFEIIWKYYLRGTAENPFACAHYLQDMREREKQLAINFHDPERVIFPCHYICRSGEKHSQVCCVTTVPTKLIILL